MSKLVPWVAVDFDHTIVDFDKPLPGAKEGLQALKDAGYGIIVHSCNNEEWIRKILLKHEIPFDHIWDGQGKPACDAYIDDRGVGFTGDWNATVNTVISIEERRKQIPRYCMKEGKLDFHVDAKTEAGE